jgi:integrase
MLLIQTPQFKVTVKYYFSNNGQHYFQRRVPLALRQFFNGKHHYRVKLEGRQESMAAEIARLARDTDKLFAELAAKGDADKTMAEAQAILAYYGLRPGDGLKTAKVPRGYDNQPHLVDWDHYMEYREDKGILTDADELAAQLLREPQRLMVSQCLDIYFANHPKAGVQKFRKDVVKHFKHIYEVFETDIVVESFNRDMAKQYIEKRLRHVTTNAVAREISAIRAIWNVVIREKELTIANPWLSLTIPNLGKDKKPRIPFTNEELVKILKASVIDLNDAKAILFLLTTTGARPSEIGALRRIDCVLDGAVPHIKITPYGDHTLKTKNSQREVSLVPQALEVLKKQLASHDSDLVFPKYADGNDVNSNSAGGAMNSFIRSLGIKGKTVYSTRHAMRDLLRHANVQSPIIDGIQGWSDNSVSSTYGLGYSLQQKLDALNLALAPVWAIN